MAGCRRWRGREQGACRMQRRSGRRRVPPMTGITEATIDANGLRFGYLAAGDRGPLALCLHGFPDSAWTWRHLLPALADAGFRAVAPFLRGYAPSGLARDDRYAIGELA